MSLKFTKMHGLGNDFMVIDGIQQTFKPDAAHIAQWADRHKGIGFDQCLIVERPRDANSDFFYRIFNADGTEVGQCGNGARCLMRFVHHYGLTEKKNITVSTETTRMHLKLKADDTVRVDFGRPKLEPENIPVKAIPENAIYHLPLAGKAFHPVYAVNVGNPHAITVVEDVDAAPVPALGQIISEHPLFPEKANAGFVEVVDSKHLKVRVYERGAGETAACGSGAVAAGIIGRLFLNCREEIKIHLPGGSLLFQWEDPAEPVYLTGPAEFIFEGMLL